jgi:hypothetical protein
MKKVFTMLLFTAGTISFAAAQSYNQKNIGNQDSKKINNDQHAAFDKNNSAGYNDSYFSYKEKQAKMEKINRDFDRKIAAVKYNRRLSGREKAKQIQLLERQQQNEISKLEYEYAKNNQKSKGKTNGHDSHW